MALLEYISSRERGGSDSFSGRRKLFWGNDDHLKSRASARTFFLFSVGAIWTLRRNYRGISLDETHSLLLQNSAIAAAEGFPNAQLSDYPEQRAEQLSTLKHIGV